MGITILVVFGLVSLILGAVLWTFGRQERGHRQKVIGKTLIVLSVLAMLGLMALIYILGRIG
ncbi:heme/copper-type cytochrome/quinol oxidase subunit 2 [Deinococcus budaensis]|uniref:Heme/copper-type cytochrome/quinol oxidase subunit 2 n=2 Tax=Deinococcus budaensis TaxID=1665626 RepID=A0A7W8GDG7_9DEIO|nr:hypothetical protein [Deinococcus budaensis]MBB5233577.1 heme/copper-type cytochrome/quinol oxidase subunit 2 [Deinococcus budaensis]